MDRGRFVDLREITLRVCFEVCGRLDLTDSSELVTLGGTGCGGFVNVIDRK